MSDARLTVRAIVGDKWLVELHQRDGRIKQHRVDPIDDSFFAKAENIEAPTWTALLRSVHERGVGSPEIQAIGEYLRARLLDGVGLAGYLKQPEAKGGRLMLQIDGYMAPTLAALPIEAAFTDRFFLVDSKRQAVHVVPDAAPALPTLPERGRLVIATAHSDSKWEREPTAEELGDHADRVRAAAEAMGWAVEVHADCTRDALQAVITSGPDLLYVACHGRGDPAKAGLLVLRDGTVSGQKIARWLEDAAESGRPTRAGIFCACSSAEPASDPNTSGLAGYLARDQRLIAAIGFRAPVRVDWAFDFTQRIFAGLKDGEPLDAAFCTARRAMDEDDPQWLLPVLYTRSAPPPLPASASTPAAHLRGLSPEATLDAGSITPRLPERPRRYFTGRVAALQRVRDALSPDRATVITAIEGEGGIGKSELARYLAHELHAAGRAVVWLDRPDADARSALKLLARAADPDFTPRPQWDDATTAERMRAALAGRRGVLFLDDVGDPACLPLLDPGPGWCTVITTRVEDLAPGSAVIPLDRLEPAEATALVSRLIFGTPIPPADGAQAVEDLIREVGRLPLALELAAVTVRDRGDGIAAYLADLEVRAAERSHIEAVLLRGLDRLDPLAQEAWLIIGLFPAVGAPARMIAAALGRALPEATPALDRLTRLRFVRFDHEHGRYWLHPEMRTAARRRALDGPDAQVDPRLAGVARALAEAARWVAEPLDRDSGQALRRWASISDVLGTIDHDLWRDRPAGRAHVAQSILHADVFLAFVVRTAQELEIGTAQRAPALDAAVEYARSSGNKRTEAEVLRVRGKLRQQVGELEAAAGDFAAALTLYQALGDVLGQANVLRAQSELRRYKGELKAAAGGLAAALPLYQALGDTLGQANVLRSRGELRLRLGELEAAGADFAAALPLYQALGSKRGQANVLKARGELSLWLGELERAARDLAAALSLYQTLGDKLGQANVLRTRGELRRYKGELEAAAADFAAALPLYQAIDDTLGQANVLKARGELRLYKGELEAAAEDFAAALPLYQALGDTLGQANVLLARGDMAHRAGDLPGALQDYDRCQPMYLALGEVIGQANVAAELARVHLRLGDRDQARRWAREAVDVGERCGNRYAAHHGQQVLAAVDPPE